MAGSISLSLTQRYDKDTHVPLNGGQLFFFAAGTTTPQSAYQDLSLTIVTLSAPDDRQYLVRFQAKEKRGDEIAWADSEVHTFTGTSQSYGIDKGTTRLIVEDADGVPLNAARLP